MAVDVALTNRDMIIRAQALAAVYEAGDGLDFEAFLAAVHAGAHYIHDGNGDWLLNGSRACPYGPRCRFGAKGGAL